MGQATVTKMGGKNKKVRPVLDGKDIGESAGRGQGRGRRRGRQRRTGHFACVRCLAFASRWVAAVLFFSACSWSWIG